MRIYVGTAAEGEDAEGAAELGEAKGGGFGFAEGAELASAAPDDGQRELIGQGGSFGAGTRGK